MTHYPGSVDIPPNTVCPWVSGRIILDMAAWHGFDGNPVWIDRIRNMARDLDRIAIQRFDYAYYPLVSCHSDS